MASERDPQLGIGEVARRLQRIEDGVSLIRKELSQEMGSMRSEFNVELKQIRTRMDDHDNDIAKELGDVRVQLNVLKETVRLKSGLWGASSGIIAAILSVVAYVLAHGH